VEGDAGPQTGWGNYADFIKTVFIGDAALFKKKFAVSDP
jgi:hypothetical protein